MRWTPHHKDQFSEIHIADKNGSNDQLLYTSPNITRAPAWSPQGNRIAWIELAGFAATVIKILDIESKKELTIAQPGGISFDPLPISGRRDLAWLPDGTHLLVLYDKAFSDRAQIGMVGVPRGDFHTVTNDVNAYSQLALSSDGKTLATVLSNVDSSLAYYKGAGGEMISSTPLRITPNSLAWAAEDQLFLITQDTGISETGPRNGRAAADRCRRTRSRTLHHHLPEWSGSVYRGTEEWRRVAPFPHECGRKRSDAADHDRHCARALLLARQPKGLLHH